MVCFYCDFPAVAICLCSNKHLCADHIITHASSPYQKHSLSRIEAGFDQTKLIREFIFDSLKSLKKRETELLNETCSLIKKIQEFFSQNLMSIKEAEKKYLKMLPNIHELELAQVIFDNKPLQAVKKCNLKEIENYYSQNLLDQVCLQQSWRLFLETHSTSYGYLCLSIDSKYVFAGGNDHTVKMWNLANKTLEYTFIGHLHNVSCVAATKKYLVSGSFDRTIRLWRLEDKSLRTVLSGHEKGVVCLATIGNKQIISGSLDDSIRVWSIKDLNLQLILKGHSSVVRKIVVTRNCKSIISCSADNSIKFWSLSTGSTEASLQSKDPLSCILLSQDGNFLYSGSAVGNIIKWSVSNRKQILSIKAHDDWIHTLVSTTNDQTLFSCSDDKTIKIWSVEGKNLATLRGHFSFVFGLAITLDQKHIVSSSFDSTIKVWSISKQCEKFTLQHTPCYGTSLAISESGQFLSYGSGKNVAVWDMFSCKKTLLKGHKLDVRCTAISYDGNIVISGSEDKKIRVWNIKNPENGFVLEYQTNDSPCIALTSDSKNLVFGLTDGLVKICQVNADNKVFELGKHDDKVDCVAVSANYIVSSSSMNIILWRIDSKVKLHSFTLSIGVFIKSIQISKDEKFIIFDEVCTNMILWDVDNKNEKENNIQNALEFYRANPEFLRTYNFFNER